MAESGSDGALNTSTQSFVTETVKIVAKESLKRFPKLAEAADNALANCDDAESLIEVCQGALASQYPKLVILALKIVEHVQEKGMFFAKDAEFSAVRRSLQDFLVNKIRLQCDALRNHPHHLLHELSSYASIFTNEVIGKALLPEREVLLTQLSSAVNIQFDVDKQQFDSLFDEIQAFRTTINHLEHFLSTTRSIFGDLPSFTSFSNQLTSKIASFKKNEDHAYREWCENAEVDLTSLEKLEKSGKLLELDPKTQSLEVTFGKNISSVNSQVSILASLGFPIPRQIFSLAEKAKRIQHSTAALEQIRQFYNTIDTQMIPSQKAMMLKLAIEFDQLIKLPSKFGFQNVSLNDVHELERYINALQKVSRRLADTNRKLRRNHATIVESLVKLANTSLLTHQAKWKEALTTIRTTVANIQTQGEYLDDQILAWKMHFDYQLYKLLELQWKNGLKILSSTEQMANSSFDLKIDLICRNGILQFRPSLEEVRARYYRELKKFISIPMVFRGIRTSENAASIGVSYDAILKLNSELLAGVYRRAESLFDKLARVLKDFDEWSVLDSLGGFEETIEENFRVLADWEAAFKMLKQKGRQVEQLPNSVSVECITISVLPLKNSLEGQLQMLFDILVSTLKKSANMDLSTLDDFVNEGTSFLTDRPDTSEKIAAATCKHDEYCQKKTSIKSHLDSAVIKYRLLQQISGANSNTKVQQSVNRWDKFEMLLESHQMMIKEQVDLLKMSLNDRILAFNVELAKFKSRWDELKPTAACMTDVESVNAAIKVIAEFKEQLNNHNAAFESLCREADSFGIEKPAEDLLRVTTEQIMQDTRSWDFFQVYMKDLKKCTEEDWISFRSHLNVFIDHLDNWSKKLSDAENRSNFVMIYIQKELDRYREVLPHLKFLRGDNWMAQHWGELFALLQLKQSNGSVLTLAELKFSHFLNVSETICQKMDVIKQLSSRAQAESSINDALNELEVWSTGTEFNFVTMTEEPFSGFVLVKDWVSIQSQIGDQRSLLMSLKDSAAAKIFVDKISLWESRLGNLENAVENLSLIQRKWVYLKPIFESGSGKSLTTEKQRFDRINQDFINVMDYMKQEKRVVQITRYPDASNTLTQMLEQLERCQKALTNFLEEKRSKFARFYFIGDEDLLEILGQSKNPSIVNNHLRKLFMGIHRVIFDGSNQIAALVSTEGEVVRLQNPVQVSDNVEKWLSDLSDEMVNTLKHLLATCPADLLIDKYPQQILNARLFIEFTRLCEESLNERSQTLGSLRVHFESLLKKFTSFDVSSATAAVEQEVLSLKIKSLVLDVIHYLDVINELIENKVTSSDSWIWQKQLRAYFLNDKRCVLKMSNGIFDYSYEYQGNPQKLVHTPLTDKCYLTLTQALRYGYGGNSFGPAGTGKTESVKALGYLFGRQVLVFNCDEGIDFKSITRIFTGLVRTGSYGCFDEFNRLENTVLSAISAQIQAIQMALRTKETKFMLNGSETSLSHNSAIFVTLNPAGKNYGGRQKLPNNLKQLFRSIAMTTPNSSQIASVLLLSEGFQFGHELGVKVVDLFDICKSLLSKQRHYDFGLRALKATLRQCGTMRHKADLSGKNIVEAEAEIIYSAVFSSTVSKLTKSDAKIFSRLIDNVFAGTKLDLMTNQSLKNAIIEAMEQLKLIKNEEQIQKVIQLHNALQQRIGVLIVGSPGTGKTTLWKILQRTYVILEKQLRVHLVYPSAIDKETLMGKLDLDTREWNDGVITSAARKVLKEDENVMSWIVCDGEILPEKVEALNSVLDDNHLLTMPTGERLQFGSNVNFLFETDSLTHASPATVSRMGMIFLSQDILTSEILVQGWILKNNLSGTELESWIKLYFNNLMELSKRQYYLTPVTTSFLTYSGLSHLRDVNTLEWFVTAIIRGFTACMTESSRKSFAAEAIRLIVPGSLSFDLKNPLLKKFNPKTGEVDSYSNSEAIDIHDQSLVPLVRTRDVCFAEDCILKWLLECHNVIIVGPPGSGKKLLLSRCIRQLRGTSLVEVICNTQTSTDQIQQAIISNSMFVPTANGRICRPKYGDQFTFFFKDIQLPKPDKYNCVEALSFLHQIVSHRGFYDSDLTWNQLDNFRVICSISLQEEAIPSHIPSRLLQASRLLYISDIDVNGIRSIYHQLAPFFLKENAFADAMAESLAAIYQQFRQKFPKHNYPQCDINPKILTRLLTTLESHRKYCEEPIVDKMATARLFAYETARFFIDRLPNEESRRNFSDMIMRNVEQVFSVRLEKVDGFFIRKTRTNVGWVSQSDFEEICKNLLANYSRDIQDTLQFTFPELQNYLAYINAALQESNGSVLMIGQPGMYRRLMVELFCYQQHWKCFSINLTKNYNFKSFANEMKPWILAAGSTNEHVIMIVEEHHLIDIRFLETACSIICSGCAPGILSKEELESAVSQIKDEFATNNFAGERIHEYFARRVRQNFHLAYLVDSKRPDFAKFFKNNPVLLSSCRVIWMEKWSQTSLKVILPKKAPKQCFALSDAIIALHNEASIELDSSPKKFESLLDTLSDIYKFKNEGLSSRKHHLSEGLSKLVETSKYADNLQKEASEQSVLVSQKQQEANDALKMITDSVVLASNQKVEVESLSANLKMEEENIIERKKSVESELAQIEPLLAAARDSVGNLRPETLSEIRALRAPPAVIRDVLEAVLRLMGIFDTSWTNMKAFLGKRGIKEEIVSFDARKITSQIRASVKELINTKPESFDEATVKRSSVAAAPLAAWVKANLEYSTVIEKIQPLEADLERLELSLKKSKSRIAQLQEDLDNLDGKVARLKDEFAQKTRDAEVLQHKLNESLKTCQAAKKLVEMLDGERIRWQSQIQEIDKQLEKLPHYSILSAAIITYLSKMVDEKRNEYVDRWKRNLQVEEFVLSQFLANQKQLLEWKLHSLPSDSACSDNALSIIYGRMTPLIIDPDLRSVQWLMKSQPEIKFETVTNSDPNLYRSLEMAIRFGKGVILFSDAIDSSMIPLLRREYHKQGARLCVQLGDKVIDVNESFKLFVITRNSGFTPNAVISSCCNVINFSITRTGLADQFLSIAIKHDRPELEEKVNTIVSKDDQLKMEMQMLEEKLLEQLAESKGNILENKALLDSLTQIKEKSLVISKSLAESEKILLELETERMKYMPLAKLGSQFYFATSQIEKWNVNYVFSLTFVRSVFQKALTVDKSNANDTSSRIAEVSSVFLKTAISDIVSGLYKTDRISFGLHLCREMSTNVEAEDYWAALLFNQMGKDLNQTSWPPIAAAPLFNVKDFATKADLKNKSLWSNWINGGSNTFPVSALSAFEKLLLAKYLKPEAFQELALTFIENQIGVALGSISTEPVATLLNRLKPNEPLLFITTPGTDPTEDIIDCAKNSDGLNQLHQTSLGQSQSLIATDLLHRCRKDGGWLFVQNAHMDTKWLSWVSEELITGDFNSSFRLIIASEPNDNLPKSFLETSYKIIMEAPPGIKNNIMRTLQLSDFYKNTSSAVLKAQSIFGLTCFHAVVQERRYFLPQGWNKFYEFSETDFRSTVELVNDLFVNGRSDWESLIGTIENAIYGGRIDNNFDLLVLRQYLNHYFNDDVYSSNGRNPVKRIMKNLALPTSSSKADFTRAAEQLPDVTDASFFGLPANIDKRLWLENTSKTLAQVRLLTSGHQSNTVDTRVFQIATETIDFWNKNLKKVSGLPANEPEDSISRFFYMELKTTGSLIEKIQLEINDLSTQISKQALEPNSGILECLINNETPSKWLDICDGPTSCQEFLRFIVAKQATLETLFTRYTDTKQPLSVDLSSFSRPLEFLNCVRHKTAAAQSISMSGLRLKTSWKDQTSLKNVLVKVEGLWMEGFSFDGTHLQEVDASAPLFVRAPTCYMAWMAEDVHDDNVLSVPLYTSPTREEYLFSIQVPCGKHDHAKWILSGACFYLRNVV